MRVDVASQLIRDYLYVSLLYGTMDLLQQLLLKHLDDEVMTGPTRDKVKLKAIEVIEKIWKYQPREAVPGDKREQYCRHLLGYFQNFDPTRASFAIIKDILELLSYLSHAYDQIDYFAVPLTIYREELQDVVVVLSAANFQMTRKPFEKIKKMLEDLFMDRQTDFSASASASIVSAAILNNLLNQWNLQILEPQEEKQREEIVLKLLRRLLSKNKQRSALAKNTLKECKYSIDYEISEVLYLALENESDIPKQFTNKSTVHETIVQLYVVDPRLILSLYSVINRLITDKDCSKRKNAIILLFRLFTRTIPDNFLLDHWKRLQDQFFSDKVLSGNDTDLLCQYSPALLTQAFYNIRLEWLDRIIKLVKICPFELAERLLDIFAEAERVQPNFFAIQNVCSRIAPLLKAGSKHELGNELLKERFLRSLCKVYLGHLEKENFNAAANLVYFILGVFNLDAAGPKNWALARVVIRLLTAGGKGPIKRAWHLVVLYSFCKADMEAEKEDINKPPMIRAVREAYRCSTHVSRTLQELLQLEGASQELLERYSKKLVCEMTAGYKSYRVAMDSVVKKATTVATFKTKLATIASFTTSESQKRKAEGGIKLAKSKFYREYGMPNEFLSRFFAMVEPLVNNDEMSSLVKYVDMKVEILLAEVNISAENDDSTAEDRTHGYDFAIRHPSRKVDFLPKFVTLDTLTSTLYDMISRYPHLAFQDPSTLNALLGLLDSEHRQLKCVIFALRAILAALDCGCTDEERNAPDHVRWTQEQWNKIKESCSIILNSTLFKFMSPEAVVNSNRELLMHVRVVIKIIIRIFARSGNTSDLNPLVQRALETFHDYEGYRYPLHARQLSVAIVGFIAAERSLRVHYKFELIGAFEILISKKLNTVSLIEKHKDWQWMGSDELPPGISLLVEEFRTLGRLVRFCGPAEHEAQSFIESIASALLISIPQNEMKLAQTYLQLSHPHEALNLFNCSCAAIIRKEAACAVLTMLENEALRYKLTVDIILYFAEFAMDPIPEVRDLFIQKVIDGLCIFKCWSTDSGKSKGTLPSVIAALIPLTCLYKADLLLEIDPEDRYRKDVETSFFHLTAYAKSLRLFRHRLRHYIAPELSDFSSNMDNIVYELPELFPEFVLCWLVPVLAKLDILCWYTSHEQLENMNETQMTIVKLIYNCFGVVLNAIISKTAFRLVALPYKILDDLPKQILKFMKFENYQERERQGLLCMLLSKALEEHHLKRDFDDQPFKGKYRFQYILAKGPLFYDIHVQQNDNLGHFAPNGRSFQALLFKIRKMPFSVLDFSEETSSSYSSSDRDQNSERSESRSESLSIGLVQRSHREPAGIQSPRSSSSSSSRSSLPLTNRKRRGPTSQIDQDDPENLPAAAKRGRPTTEHASTQETDPGRLCQIAESATTQRSHTEQSDEESSDVSSVARELITDNSESDSE